MTGALLLLALLKAPKWELTLDQNFNGPKGQAPDAKIWGRDLGPARQNGELQTYTDGNANAFLDGEGHLVIEARKEPKDGREYTSARLKTEGKFEQRYGRFEARMKMPLGHGIWPAFWMLGSDIGTVGWPRSGEIDILENIGRDPTGVYGTLHGPGYSGSGGIGKKTTNDTLSTQFHDYAVEWGPEKIVWFFDGKPYHTVEAKDVGNKRWPFEQPFFLILNLAVGGGFPGNPDDTTVFPQRFVIDYVKIWKDANLKVDEAALAKRHAERMAAKVSFKQPAPAKIPGIVKLSDYLPEEGVGFHDSDDNNEGGAYRTDGVDIGAAGPTEAPFTIGWTHPGEWLTYDIDVSETGNYKVEMTVASEGAGGAIELSIDGHAPFSTVTVPDTGGWTNWHPVGAGTVGLPAGRHRLKVFMRSAGTNGAVGNVAMLRFARG
jgi:beta-glucanase (GH16 family)